MFKITSLKCTIALFANYSIPYPNIFVKVGYKIIIFQVLLTYIQPTISCTFMFVLKLITYLDYTYLSAALRIVCLTICTSHLLYIIALKAVYNWHFNTS